MTPNVLATRYASAEIARIWSPEHKIVLERRLWIAVLRAQRDLGVETPDGVIEAYEAVVDQVDLASIAEREKVTRHDVKARIEEFAALAGSEHIHKGMTSRDLTENVVHELLVRPNVDLSTEAGLRAAESVRDYFAAVTGVDEQVGRVVEALRAEGILDQTLVVLTSDHGEAMGSHGLMAKGTWYEESVRVPSIWRLPGVLTPRRDDVLISTPDIHPTLLGLLGLSDQVPESVQGRDLSSALKGEAGAERPSCAVYAHTSTTDQVGPSRGLLTHQWTYAVRGLPAATEPAPERFLFDNVNDPYQLRNLADVDGALVREMHELMTASLSAAGYLPGAS